MKKRNVNSLLLNKQSIASFAHQLHGGQASNSGLQVSCICETTKEKYTICRPVDLPSPIAPGPVGEPVGSDEAPVNAPVDSPAG
jgi:hypothetical protein